MTKIEELEREAQVVKEAMKIWPEHVDQYIDKLVALNGEIGRRRRTKKKYIARSYQRKELDS